MKKLFTTIVLGLLFSCSVCAQNAFGINYSVAFPSGDLSDFTEPTSWRGLSFEYAHFLKSNMAIGGSFGWQTFYEDRGFITETVGNETISGFRQTYVNTFPLYVTGSYLFGSAASEIRPFATLGAGFVHVKVEEETGLFSNEDDSWNFSLRPEIGLQYEVNYGFGIQVSARYHYISDVDYVGNPSYFAIAAGVYWKR